MQHTTYVHEQLHYFFSASEHIDINIGSGLAQNISLSSCLDFLEQTNSSKNVLLDAGLSTLGHLLILGPSTEEKPQQAVLEQDNEFNEAIRGSNAKDSSLRTSYTAAAQRSTINNLLYNKLSFNEKNAEFFYSNDGLKTTLFALKNYVNTLKTGKNIATITDEMVVKTLFNLFYLGIMFWYTKAIKDTEKIILKELEQFLIDTEVDGFLISMVTLTLEAHYLPIKKLVILYTRILSILFHRPNLYSDQDLLKMCTDNLLAEDFVKNYKDKNPPNKEYAKRATNPIQKFYAVHNMGDCPLAQSIVVGLLRSLLTICNSQTHGKFVSHGEAGKKGSTGGADSYRQWQVTYQFLLQQHISNMNLSNSNRSSNEKNMTKNNNNKYINLLSPLDRIQLENYQQYNSSPNPQSPCHYQFYSHKIYTTSSIAVFLSFLLISFKQNNFIQFSYLFQLISDANGILVFLKFLTDKFQNLVQFDTVDLRLLTEDLHRSQGKEEDQQEDNFQRESIEITEQFIKEQQEKYKAKQANRGIKSIPADKLAKEIVSKYGRRMFSPIIPIPQAEQQKNEVMLSVYSVLVILYGACNNYAEKTRSYLFEYNSYLIIKKIPHIFMQTHKNDDQLPSKEQLEREFDIRQSIGSQKGGRESKNPKIGEAHVAKLCYDLLKIQIPFFSKKMKQSVNNMRMIVDIYCQLPKQTTPIVRTEFDKIILKSKLKKVQVQKYIRSVEELKIAHNEYNNYYYWANQDMEGLAGEDQMLNNKENKGIKEEYLQMDREKIEQWLEENVWRYYD